MPLQKQPISVNFSQGIDSKTDPFQVPTGKFLALSNSVFTKAGMLQKRNGFGLLSPLPDNTATFLTTFNGNLTAIGTKLEAYIAGPKSWINTGAIQPIQLDTLTLVRSNTNQSQADTSIAPNGVICTVFTDNLPNSISKIKYSVSDSNTGQIIVPPSPVPVTSGTTIGSPRVFLLGTNFIIVFTNQIAGAFHIQYIAINSITGVLIQPNTDVATSYTPSATVAWDGIVLNSNLYIAYDSTLGGQSVKITYITTNMNVATPITFVASTATAMSVTADPVTDLVYATFFNSGDNTTNTVIVDSNLHQVLAPTLVASIALTNVTSSYLGTSLLVTYEVANTYPYDTAIATNNIAYKTISQTGTVSAQVLIARSVGLASKSFVYSGMVYFLVTYQSAFQPSYFLMNQTGKIVAKLAYSNGPGYYLTGLPSVSLVDNVANVSYLYKDSIQSVNKNTNIPAGSQTAGIYAQTGINLAKFTIGTSRLSVSEIGANLNISGGFITAYDGAVPVEQEFFLYPDNVEVTANTQSGAGLIAQQYYYQATYEWSDNQGNLFRSSPSIPVSVTLTSGQNSTVINVPTLRLTAKTQNPVKIVIYRWSVAQQIYYQVTSITDPLLNDTSVDYLSFIDVSSDADILGNNIIYTNGGVLENISPPASDLLTLFDNRLWLVDSEDRNLLWFSKQVIESTPVEMSDLLTLYVAPSTASQGSTGPITAIAPMDDKLIVFKRNALGYISGIGPDNTGANNGYSPFTLINSVVGSANQQSIVFTPAGLMFQSNKGIWLLGRDLSTQYIGAPVEIYNSASVLSAINVPETNQVRFTLDNGITLMYDYYFGQWGTFSNIPAVSSTIYNGLHTYINGLGQALQETPGLYLDNSSAVLLSFTTNWMNLAGVQGYERFYQMLLLGKYITPFKLNVQFAFNYNDSIAQSTIVTPDNFSPVYGGDQLWGSGQVWGGPTNVFESRIFPNQQKVESFQVTINEIFDPSYGIIAGAGLTLSGMNLTVGLKKGTRTSSAGRSFG